MDLPSATASMAVLGGLSLPHSPMRIHVADHCEADAAWRILNAVPDELFRPVELHIDGHGPACLVVRDENGDQTTAPVAAALAHSCPA
jgi:hypothetical protein